MKKKEIGDTIIFNKKSNHNRASVGFIKTQTLEKFQTISPKYKSEMNIEINNNNKKDIFILRPYKQKNLYIK